MSKIIYTDQGGNGASINRTLDATVALKQLASDGSWLGINQASGDSGDVRAWVVDDAVYQWYVPDGLSVSEGDVVYVDPTDITGNIPDDTAYSTSSGAGKVPIFKALADKVTANGSGDHYVIGKSLLHQQGG